jgi:hypothetical protein
MTRAEWIELSSIGAIAAASWLAWPLVPSSPSVWEIVLGFSALLLAQSLVRDIAILLHNRREQSNVPQKEMQCFCLESTVGTTGVIASAALIGLGSAHQIAMSRPEFILVTTAALVVGFIIKDLVISWNPFGLRREKNHLNLIVRWKSKPRQKNR